MLVSLLALALVSIEVEVSIGVLSVELTVVSVEDDVSGATLKNNLTLLLLPIVDLSISVKSSFPFVRPTEKLVRVPRLTFA